MSNEWEVTCNRYVAFIDIMGFKDMVMRMPHDDVYQLMLKINGHRKFSESVDWHDNKIYLAKSTTYSDSIIVYSKDDSFDSLDFLISTVASLSNYLFTEAIPHKGAVAFGRLTLDLPNSIFFGQPLIDAYLLQEEVKYYGILFHASADREIADKKHYIPIFTYKYLCPLKNGNANHDTIYPFYARLKDINKISFDDLMAGIQKLKFQTSGHLRKYIDNTEAYLESVSR